MGLKFCAVSLLQSVEKGFGRGAGVTAPPGAAPTNGDGFPDQWLPPRAEGQRGSAMVHCPGPFEVRWPRLCRSRGAQGCGEPCHSVVPLLQAAAWSGGVAGRARGLAPPLGCSSWRLSSALPHALHAPPHTHTVVGAPRSTPSARRFTLEPVPGRDNGRQARAQK